MKKNEYKCTNCGEVYETGWTDEEAIAEYVENFKTEDLSDAEVVCDDCYKKITKEYPIETYLKNNNTSKNNEGYISDDDFNALKNKYKQRVRELVDTMDEDDPLFRWKLIDLSSDIYGDLFVMHVKDLLDDIQELKEIE